MYICKCYTKGIDNTNIANNNEGITNSETSLEALGNLHVTQMMYHNTDGGNIVKDYLAETARGSC